MNCLVVGPGLDMHQPQEYVRTYQPYELANCIRRAKVIDYQILVVDNNYKILKEVRRSPAILKIRLNFELDKLSQNPEKKKRHFNTFFTDISNTCSEKEVEIPANVTNKIRSSYCDIITDEIPENFYDIVICTTLLTHYDPDVTHEYSRDPTLSIVDKLAKSIKTGGFFITSESCPDGFKFLEDDSNFTDSLHITSASLFEKQS